MAELIHVEVEVDPLAAAEDPERVDEFTRELLVDVRQSDVESAELIRGPAAPAGAKGGIEVASAIAIGLTTNAFWEIGKMLVARLRSQRAAVVRIDGPVAGRHVKFEGSPSELASLLETLSGASEGTAPEG